MDEKIRISKRNGCRIQEFRNNHIHQMSRYDYVIGSENEHINKNSDTVLN